MLDNQTSSRIKMKCDCFTVNRLISSKYINALTPSSLCDRCTHKKWNILAIANMSFSETKIEPTEELEMLMWA